MKKMMFTVLLMFVFAAPAYAEMMNMSMKGSREGHAHMMGMGGMDMMGDMMGMCNEHADHMGLSDAQITKMKPLHTEMQKKQARFEADLKIAEIELREIMDVRDFDLDKASAAVKKIEGIKTVHHIEMLEFMKDMRTILTDEQFKKMKNMMPMKMVEKEPAKKMMKKPK